MGCCLNHAWLRHGFDCVILDYFIKLVGHSIVDKLGLVAAVTGHISHNLLGMLWTDSARSPPLLVVMRCSGERCRCFL